ncbi:MAG: glycosyltransferase [Candidatus Eremiobacteraeota bacterium]|nr:glycosyltransferase [Candidatus Eremiobacteraeota bacterium]MBC5828338.1 glycosyltransferase [Candidatus Eremiobacteraeota bacterium]
MISSVPLRDAAEIGSAYFSAALAQALTSADMSVELWAKGSPSEFAAQSNPIIRCWQPGIGSWFDILATAVRRKPDLVHVQHSVFLFGPGATGEIATLLLLIGLAALRIPLVITCHDVPSLSQISTAYIKLHKYNFPVAAVKAGLRTLFSAFSLLSRGIIVHQQAFARILAEDYKVRREKITIIPLLPLPFRTFPKEQARRRLRISEKADVALFFGYATAYKGIDVLLNAMKQLPSRGRDGVLLLLGAGKHPKVDGRADYLAYYDALVEQARSLENVRFVGFIPNGEIDLYIDACDVVVLPYVEFQGMSGPLNQCASHRKAYLISRAIADGIDDNGPEVFDPSPAALADTLTRYFTVPEFKRSVEQSCQAFSDRVLSAAWRDRTRQTYESALGRSGNFATGAAE